MTPYRQAAPYIPENSKSIFKHVRSLVLNLLVIAFGAWTIQISANNGNSRIAQTLVMCYGWVMAFFTVISILYFRRMFSGLTAPKKEELLDGTLWTFSWAIPVRVLYHTFHILCDFAIIYILVQLQCLITAWVYGILHVFLVYFYLYPMITPLVRERALALIPVGSTPTPVNLKF